MVDKPLQDAPNLVPAASDEIIFVQNPGGATPTDANSTFDTIPLNILGTPIADLSLGGFKLTNVLPPIDPSDAATKGYVDTLAASNIILQGGYDAATNAPNLDATPIPGILAGHHYVVTVGGDFFTTTVNVGDSLIAQIDDPVVEGDWIIAATNLDAANVKALYESNADTNEFDDAEQAKLAALKVPTGGATLTADHGAKLTSTAVMIVPTGVSTRVPWDGEIWDTDDYHDNVTNNTRITIPAGLGGKYLITFSGVFAAPPADPTSIVEYLVLRNGINGVTFGQQTAAINSAGSISSIFDLADGDYIEAFIEHNDTGDRTFQTPALATSLSVQKLDINVETGANDHSASVALSATQPAASGSFHLVSWDVVEYDTDGYHDAADQTRFVIPVGMAGKYLVTANGSWANNDGGIQRYIDIFVNGTTNYAPSRVPTPPGELNSASQSSSAIIDLNEGDFIQVRAFQDSGGLLDFSNNATRFQLQKIDQATVIASGAIGGGAGASGHTIQNAGVAVADRTNLNYLAPLVATDNAGGDSTDISLDTLVVDHGCRLGGTGTQSIPNNGTVEINWDAEDYDTDGYHDNATNNTRITIPAGLGGKYLVVFNGAYSPGLINNAARALFRIHLNGPSPVAEISTHFIQPLRGTVSAILDLVPGDFLEANVSHNSGSAAPFNMASSASSFSVQKIDSLGVGGAGGGGGTGVDAHIIQDDAVDLTQRAHLNFTGASFTVTDNPGGDSTDIAIVGSTGSYFHALTTGTQTLGQSTNIFFNNSNSQSNGTDITYDNATGLFTLQPGTYEVTYSLAVDQFTNSSLFIIYGLVDETNAFIGVPAITLRSDANTGPNAYPRTQTGIIEVADATTQQFRVRGLNSATTARVREGHVLVKKLAAGGDSGGTGDLLDGGNTTGADVSIGTNDFFDTILEANNTPVLRAATNSRVAIGDTTSGPRTTLHVTPIAGADANNVPITTLQNADGFVQTFVISGDPNGVVAAELGAVAHDIGTGKLWVKTSPTGNVGWLDQSGLLTNAAFTNVANVFTANQTVGTLTVADPDTGVSVARALPSPSNTHGFVHEDTITSTTPNRGHASFDSKMIVDGTEDHDHIAGFQARPEYSSTGVISRITGFQSLPIQNGGLVTDLRHYEARDAGGTGPITNQYAFAVRQPLTRGVNNFTFHSQIAEQSARFGGRLLIDSEDNFDVGLLVSTNYGTLSPKWRSRAARGTEAAPTDIVTGQAPMNIESYGYIDGDFRRMSLIQVTAAGVPSPTSYASRVRFGSVVTGSTAISDRMAFENTGSINFLGNTVTGLPAGVDPTDAVNKAQLDAASSGGLPAVDTTSIVMGSADATKQVRLEVDGLTTGTTRIITPPDADINLPGTNIANTFTATQTIRGEGVSNALAIERYGGGGGVGSAIIGRAAQGNAATPAISNDEDLMLAMRGQAYDGAAFGNSAIIRFNVDGVPSAGSTPGIIRFETAGTGTVTPQTRMSIDQAGVINCVSNPVINAAEAANLTDVPNLGQVASIAQYRAGTSAVNINEVSPGVVLPLFGLEEFLDAGFTRLNESQMQCDFDGVVEVHCSLRAISTGVNIGLTLRVGLNGTLQQGISESLFIRGASGLDSASTSITKHVTVANGDIITFHAARSGTVSTATTMNNQTFAYIKRTR